MNMQLLLSNVRSGYGRVRIINDVSLEVAPAEILAVIGRNGVGKTTLMRTIMGEVPVQSGKIEFRSIDITGLPPSKRARLGIGYVPQGRGIFTKLPVGANLSLGTSVGAAHKADLNRAFEFFPILKRRMTQLAGSMSGGEQQQLSIGRILVGQPDILLMDEPSEGIQPSIVQEIGSTIRRLRDEIGLTVVIVEQNLNLIRSVADRCVVIDHGVVVATPSPDELADSEVASRYLAI